MKVLLIFPPNWSPYRPYLSLPSLSAYLKSNGINVIQKDFNVEAYNIIMSKDYLKKLEVRLQKQFDVLDSKDNLMPGLEQEYYCDLFKAKAGSAYIARKIEYAKGIFRSRSKFYDINEFDTAFKILTQMQSVVSIGSFPSGQDLFWPLNVRIQRSFEDIKKITQNGNENPFLELYENNLLPFILKEDPNIIGISIIGESQLIPALTLSRLIKAHHKKAHVVVGGYAISMLSDVLMKYEEFFTDFFDSAVVGEGERPLLKLVQNISNGKTLDDVPNLIYSVQGKIRANEVLPPEDMNLLPTPCFEGMPLDLYLNPEPVLPILSSRGCYWGKCAFCSNNESCHGKYRRRDPKKVVDDMQELSKKHGVTNFAFSDEAISPGSMSSLSDELISRETHFNCSTNVRLERQFTAELCNKIYKAGFKLLYFGLESGCSRILDLMDKGITKETAVEVCRNAHNAGIWNHLYTFLGFPTESWEEAHETIEFLFSNKNVINSFSLGNFVLNKGASLLNDPEKYGIKNYDAGPHKDFCLAYDYTVNSGLTSNEAMELSERSRSKIIEEYDTKEIFKLNYEDILLYLSHYGNSASLLNILTPPKKEKKFPHETITKKSIPKIKSNIVLDRLRFNILDIESNIAEDKNTPVYPETNPVLFNLVSGQISPVNPLFMEILTLCDGKRNVQQIAYVLSQKYNGQVFKIEEDCIKFLNILEREGYIIF
jgi:radical SAM superfamily enzyme YgiQ (UPF0313 family)